MSKKDNEKSNIPTFQEKNRVYKRIDIMKSATFL